MTPLTLAYVGTRSVIIRREGKSFTIGWSTLRAAARQDDAILRTVYAATLAAAERKLLTEMLDDANRRVVACRRHRAARSKDRAYFGPVSVDENRAAHGNICVHETCSCGAERRRNVNGLHEEIGQWFAPDVDLTDVRSAIDEGGRQ